MHVMYAVFVFIAAIVLGPLIIIFTFLHIRRRSINKRELDILRNIIMEMRAEIADIKEQIADFIIKTN